MISAHFDYFKKLLQGESETSFKSYWVKHKTEFEEDFPRAQLLRLKFAPIEEIQKILKAAGVEYHPDPVAIAREKYYLTFDVSVLDDNGRLKGEHVKKIFNGAVDRFHAGKADEALERLNKYIGRVGKVATAFQVEKLRDLTYFAEIEAKYGDAKLSRFIFDVIGGVKSNDDRISDLKNIAIRAMREAERSQV